MDTGEGPATRGDGDWLFEPALRDDTAPWVYGPKPWRVGSQVYVAFFGGVVAVTAIAFLNARRLGLTEKQQRLIAVAGVLGLIVVLVAAIVMDPQAAGETRNVRFVGRGAALLLFFVLARVQRSQDRIFAIRDGEYESLWGPGIVASLAGGLVQALITVAVLALS